MLLARRGLGFTVDEVAEEAGVSARTVFRHFATRDLIVAAAIEAVLEVLRSSLVATEVDPADPRRWLTERTIQLHDLINTYVGNAWWEIYAPHNDIGHEVVAAINQMRIARENLAQDVAQRVWQAAGGSGPPPKRLADTFLINISGFGFQALAVSREVTPEETGVLCADIAWSMLEQELAQPAK